MTDLLHLPAQADAPIACDMSSARDTPDERLADYGRLFERALVRRDRHEQTVVFAFRATPGTREQVEDLARREAACCPFLDYRVQAVGDEVLYTITNPLTGLNRADADVTLDAFYALPDDAGSDHAGLLDRLAGCGSDGASIDSTPEKLDGISEIPSPIVVAPCSVDTCSTSPSRRSKISTLPWGRSGPWKPEDVLAYEGFDRPMKDGAHSPGGASDHSRSGRARAQARDRG